LQLALRTRGIDGHDILLYDLYRSTLQAAIIESSQTKFAFSPRLILFTFWFVILSRQQVSRLPANKKCSDVYRFSNVSNV